MRLIDADALLKNLKKECAQCIDSYSGCCYECLIDAIKYADEYKQLQKPIPLNKLKSITNKIDCYIEYPDDESIYHVTLYSPIILDCPTPPLNDSQIRIKFPINNYYCYGDSYNRKWRCWTAEPTAKERNAAKWEV